MSNVEAEILHLARQGNEEAFTAIVETFQKPVYNLCYRMLGNPQEAEDAAQESFWRAYQAIRSYDPNRSFITWLLSIAAHHCIDRQRKRQIPTYDIDADPDFGVPDSSMDPERSVSEMEGKEFIQEQLSRLGSQDRAVLVLKYWYDLSEKEIADMLELTTSAVKSRLFRARKELAKTWETETTHFPNSGEKHYESPAF